MLPFPEAWIGSVIHRRPDTLVWGRREDCDLLSKVMPAVTACLPPAPEPAPATPPPLLLWQPSVIESLMDQANLLPRESLDISGPLAFPDLDTATKATLSASARAIAHSGEARVCDVQDSLRRLVREDCTIRLDNRFRLVLGTPLSQDELSAGRVDPESGS